MQQLTYGDVRAAAARVAGRTRPAVVSELDHGVVPTAPGGPLDASGLQDCRVWLVHEYMQHTGSFKARGAQNFLLAHREAGTLPDAGLTIASGGNAGLACAWAAQQHGVRATVFLPETAPRVKVERLRGYGAEVRLTGREYAAALAACEEFAAATGALASHAYAHPLIGAGAGTLLDEVLARVPDLDTVVVSVGGGGLFAGVAVAAQHHGIRTVGVEPENCRAWNAGIEAGRPVDVEVASVAADSLGARRTWQGALDAAKHDLVHSVLVTDAEIVAARQALWDSRRIAVEHAAATALAPLLTSQDEESGPPSLDGGPLGRAYRPRPGEKVAVILCGSNTDPSDLVGRVPKAA